MVETDQLKALSYYGARIQSKSSEILLLVYYPLFFHIIKNKIKLNNNYSGSF